MGDISYLIRRKSQLLAATKNTWFDTHVLAKMGFFAARAPRLLDFWSFFAEHVRPERLPDAVALHADSEK